MAGGTTAFDDIWPAARERLTRALRAQGFDEATAEDAVAEAAARAVARGLISEDLDDFCRWAFIVARNVARDAARRGSRVVLFDVVPDRVDAYDLADEVESRHDLREAAAAMRTLSEADRGALLQSLNADGDPAASRREAVMYAVRRHRARVRLRHALGEVGGFFGWLRRPWAWRLDVLGAYDRAGAALLAPLLGMGMGLWSPVGPSAVPAMVAAGVGMDETAAAAPSAGSVPMQARVPRAAPAQAPEAHGSSGETFAVRPQGYVADFTVSPSYEEDHTVFLATVAGKGSCPSEQTQCGRLYKSMDGGATWEELAATGRGIGTILLPPTYPRDDRLFSNGNVVTVSEDGGRTFKPLGASNGDAAMSPLFSSTDPRILFAGDALLASAPMQYVDGDAALTPLVLPLPPGAHPQQMWFSNDYANDGRLLVYVSETPHQVEDLSDTHIEGVRYSVYSCTVEECHRVLTKNISVIVDALWTKPGVVFFDAGIDFFRSVDGGRTFTKRPLPWKTFGVMVKAGPDNSLIAKVREKLYTSTDDALTWQQHQDTDVDIQDLTVLPDGVVLAHSMKPDEVVACSLDGGHTWQDPCRRPPAA